MKPFMFDRFVRPVKFYKAALFVVSIHCWWACGFTAPMNVPQNGTVDICGGLAEGRGFRCINRRNLHSCPDSTRYVDLRLSTQGPLANEENVTVTVSGILHPTGHDWVALISPSSVNSISSCPQDALKYKETGDLKSHPLLCHYPVKAQFLKNDASYTSCAISSCKRRIGHKCLVKTCSGSITFNVINIRTDIEFVVFRGGFHLPCILKRSEPLKFTNPIMPLYGHLSSMDSTGTAIKISWISGNKQTQYVKYGERQLAESSVATYTRNDMCGGKIPSAAKDFGWHDPGYIHTAQMTGLLPSRSYLYTYGSNLAGWSNPVQLWTPPSGGASEVRFLSFGDMGQAPRDKSDEHYIQPGSLGVIEAIREKVVEGKVDSVFHIGDISYATGFLVEWDYFLQMINPVASRVPYMTAIGNHERDFPFSGSKYKTADSGGECGVPYEKYFHMPTAEKDKPWYSISQGPVHFTVISTEHNWGRSSEQYEWIKRDLASADRKQTPWIIFCGHRPMYSTGNPGLSELVSPTVDHHFVSAIEPLLMEFQVDLALWGHVHNYERTCSVFEKACTLLPTKDIDGMDTYNNTDKYSAPVHVVIGTGGFSLDKFKNTSKSWSLIRISEYGYADIHAKTQELSFKFVSSSTRAVEDSFKIIKGYVGQ